MSGTGWPRTPIGIHGQFTVVDLPGDRAALVFASREGSPLTTASVRRQLRRVMNGAGITGVHPHMFRRTVATVINDQASVNLAAELLGQH